MTLEVKGFGVTQRAEKNLTVKFGEFSKNYPNRTLFKIRAKDDVYIIIKCGGNNYMDVVTGKILRIRSVPNVTGRRLASVNDISQAVIVNAFSIQKASITLED